MVRCPAGYTARRGASDRRTGRAPHPAAPAGPFRQNDVREAGEHGVDGEHHRRMRIGLAEAGDLLLHPFVVLTRCPYQVKPIFLSIGSCRSRNARSKPRLRSCVLELRHNLQDGCRLGLRQPRQERGGVHRALQQDDDAIKFTPIWRVMPHADHGRAAGDDRSAPSICPDPALFHKQQPDLFRSGCFFVREMAGKGNEWQDCCMVGSSPDSLQ